MPGLRDLLDLIETRAIESGANPAFMRGLEAEIRQRWGGERFYVTPPESRKDPDRAVRIRELARTLPTGVVAQRLDVSPSYVRRLARRKPDKLG
jgi:hypothetical protein